jgi:P27 family predicted phage terminase small subunit
MGNKAPNGVKKPLELKEQDGTKRADRDPANPPTVTKGLPEPPEWLSEEAAASYRSLARTLENMGVGAREDVFSLSLLCSEFADYLKLKETLDREGYVYEAETDRGGKQLKKRPEADLVQVKSNFILKALKEFGLTAASRSKLETGGDKKEEDPLEGIL